MKTRLAHFFWLATNPEPRDFDYKMFAAVHTFLLYHPEWETTLWTNCPFAGQLYDYCVQLGLQTATIDRVKNQVNISAEVDFHKWDVLYKLGGMALDIADTITLASFNDLYDSADRLLWSHYTIGIKQMGNGWLCINRPAGDICRLVIEKHIYSNEIKPVGSWEAESFKLSKTAQDVSRSPIDQKIVFGGHFTHHRNMIWNNLLDIPPQCKQMHFYYGNVLGNEMQLKKKEFLDGYYAELPRWKEQANIITQTYARSLAGRNIDDVPCLSSPKG